MHSTSDGQRAGCKRFGSERTNVNARSTSAKRPDNTTAKGAIGTRRLKSFRNHLRDGTVRTAGISHIFSQSPHSATESPTPWRLTLLRTCLVLACYATFSFRVFRQMVALNSSFFFPAHLKTLPCPAQDIDMRIDFCIGGSPDQNAIMILALDLMREPSGTIHSLTELEGLRASLLDLLKWALLM
jgi:hypothetical protein